MRPIVASVGPNAADAATSQMVRFDDWAPGQVAVQVNVSGTANWTLQSSLDDPNDPSNPTPLASMTWVNSSDTNAVGATGNVQTNFQFAPRYARILKNTGTGNLDISQAFIRTSCVLQCLRPDVNVRIDALT